MNFRTNLNKLSLIANEKIKFYFEDKVVEFVPPSLRLYLLDLDYSLLAFVLRQTPESLSKLINPLPFVIENKYETFLLILKLEGDKHLNIFNKIFPNITFEEDQLKCEGIPLTSEEYDILIEALEVSCSEKDLDKFLNKLESKEDHTASNSLIEEAQKRLSAAKEKGKPVENKKQKEESTQKGKGVTIDQIVISVLYEFPSLSIERIYDMNMFTLLQFWSYVSKVVDNQIQIIAAGNGNLKKFTYFIN